MLKAVFITLLTTVQHTGWVCHTCQHTSKAKLETLMAKQSAVTDEMAIVTTSMEQVCHDINTVKINCKISHKYQVLLSHCCQTPKGLMLNKSLV